MNEKDRFEIKAQTITYDAGGGKVLKTVRPVLQMGYVTTVIVGGDFAGTLECMKELKPDFTGTILFCCGCGSVGCGSSLIVAKEGSNKDYVAVKYQTVGCEMPVYLAKSVKKTEYAKEIQKLQKLLKKIMTSSPP